MLLILLILILLLGFGGYHVGNRWNDGYGTPVGLVTVVILCLIVLFLGGFGSFHGLRW